MIASCPILTLSVRIYEIRPTVSPPSVMPSYSFCAVRMVRVAPNPSLRDASCCIVDVVNGGAARRFTVFRSTDLTV